MKELRTEITINAPIEIVWKLLTDFNRYPEWNPFIKSISGIAAPGEKLVVELQPPDSKPMVFRPVCKTFLPPQRFSWKGRLLAPGIFDGEHIFELEHLLPNTTKLVHREKFSGILVPFLWKQLNNNTRRGFEMMNEKLKWLAEKNVQ